MEFNVKNLPGAIIIYDDKGKTVMAYDEESAHKNFDFDEADWQRNSYSAMYDNVYSTWLFETKLNYSEYSRNERHFLANTMTAFCVAAVRNSYPECRQQQKKSSVDMNI